MNAKETIMRRCRTRAARLLGLIPILTVAAALVAVAAPAAYAQESAGGESVWITDVAVDTLWTLVAAFLVFFMNAGFGCVEAGFCRAKNAVNILAKNFVVFGISSIAFWLVGWAIMFGDGNSFLGTSGWLVAGADNSPATGDAYQGVYSSISWTGTPLFAKFFFQLVFAGTAATIVSGCVAERIHYRAYMIFAFFLVALSYPITGHWIWGGGWLQNLGIGTSPARLSCTQLAAGPAWPAFCCSARAWASSTLAACTRSPATAWRWYFSEA